MTSLHAYGLLEDAWTGGVADWCRAASGFVLGGGQAWMVTTSDGQANWIKRRLLCEGISLFGVEFLDARALRRELCLREGVAPPTYGRHALELLLRLHALAHEDAHPALAAVARHPGACLAALDEYAAAGWMADGPELFADLLPAALHDWLPLLRTTGSWVPEVDQTLRHAARETPPDAPPLAVCVFGWNAAHWPLLDLLAAACESADRADVYIPSPRGTSEGVQQGWLASLEGVLGVDYDFCEASDFESAQGALAARLEGSDLATEQPLVPELLAGRDTADMAALACDFVARWLAARPAGKDGLHAADAGQRLLILSPGRDVASVAVVKALAAAGVAVEDEVGEQPEPSLSVQVQRAILAYHQSEADLAALLALIELLNELAAASPPPAGSVLARVCPLDPVATRRALYSAFAEVQHHSARVLGERATLGRADVAGPLRELIDHLGTWPERGPWNEALARWEGGLNGFGLTTEILEPLWSQLAGLPVGDDAPAEAFFQFLSGVLAGVPPRRAAEGRNRFARVVVTSLDGAMGQTWGGALFLDSNEGAWPIYPGENPFLDDADRARLNARRTAMTEEGGTTPPPRGYLLSAADHAQLEHFRFLEILENCTGPLAFAGVARDLAEPSKELHANEWALRCVIESGYTPAGNENLLDRWRQAVRRTHQPAPTLTAREHAHLRDVFARRQDPAAAFDGYFFDFSALADPDGLPLHDAWSGRDLETIWNRPATFALRQVFDAESWRDEGGSLSRREGWAVGRLVHGWLRVALGTSDQPRRMTGDDWQNALAAGLSAARTNTERALRQGLGDPDELPFWWRSTLGRAEWTTRRCLETLAATALRRGEDGAPPGPRWLCLERTFQVDLQTVRGPLKLRARCDAVLLDRPELAGASALMIDVRTGSAPPTGAPTLAQLADGRGLGVGTLRLMGVAAGLDSEGTAAGVIHPDASNPAQWNAENAVLLDDALAQLAGKQSSLAFGQKGALAGGHRQDDAEDLPLATIPVPPAVLAAKGAAEKFV